MVTDLAAFLLARIAEDEAAARAAMVGFPTGEWTDDGGIYAGHPTREVVDWVYEDARPHIARHDPARVLAECAAKRRIVEVESGWRRLHDMAGAINVQSFPGDDALVIVDGKPMTVDEFDAVYTEPSPPSLTLRLLALPYAEHPDYREEWRA